MFLTTKSHEIDIVVGLELGAADYVIKPFSMQVLISRIRAVLRSQDRAVIKNSELLKVGKLSLYMKRRKVTYNGKPVQVTNAEFNILRLMAKKPGWVFSRSEIMSFIHDEGQKVTNNSINVHIHGLRKKLGEGKGCLQTVHNAGYKIID
jgi:two-component system phosphate regulon response regulator PhoB